MTIRRHPLPPQRAAPERCDTPPAGTGPVYNPPHPFLGILFVFLIAEALLWGASVAAPARGILGRLGSAYAAAFVCTCGALHFLDRVDLRHVLAKIGWRAPAPKWVALATAASLGAWIAFATGEPWSRELRLRDPESHPVSVAALVVLLAVAALWQESFCRGYTFAGLMRRHGFWMSAGSAASLGAADLFILARLAPPTGIVLALLLELPLSLALARIFWISQSLWPCLLVRFAVLLALFCGAYWPMAAAAVLLWTGSSWMARRAPDAALSLSAAASRAAPR